MKKCRIKGNSAFISSCHPRVFLSGISSLLKRQSGGDSQLQHLGMTPLFNNSAFTLIELLVVVLIIGILAAVALPQYQKAVRKSRYASLKPVVKAVKDAQELYFEEHGSYATESELDDLAIDIPAGVDVELSATDGHDYVSLGHEKLNNRYTMYLAHSDSFANNIYCEADDSLDSAKELCVADGGQDTGTVNAGYRLYLLAGNSTGSFSPTEGGVSCDGEENECTLGDNPNGTKNKTVCEYTPITGDMIRQKCTTTNRYDDAGNPLRDVVITKFIYTNPGPIIIDDDLTPL